MRRFASALATAALAFVFHIESAAGEPAVLIPITLTPTRVRLDHWTESCVWPYTTNECLGITGVDRAELNGAVAEIVDNYFQIQTGPEGVTFAQAEFEFAIPDDVPLGSSVIVHRTQSGPFVWVPSDLLNHAPFQYYGFPIAKVTSTLLNVTVTVPFNLPLLDPVDTVPGPAYPGDVVKYVVRVECGDYSPNPCAPSQSIRLDFRLLTTGTAAASLSCKADLTGDGVVNFADLAKMKSVFFQSCTP